MDMDKTTSKQLRRTHDGRMVAGVCSGAGRFLGVDPNVIRLGLAVFTLFGGAGIGIYAIAWLLVPEEGASKSVAEDLFKKASDSPTVQDAVRKTKNTVGKDRTHA
ncbi:PspC domain-containing protein [Actinomadura darangshiensis]|uniref:PspC domain-containing protein n=1 Tax=Actinomadura darangshiensis TaxID=705336 RepID=A0A4R5B075_9ACTN|nr:PspC domain-containing protein [Actinomadura darangshiensis]TDD77860.1 PspC domain-containing protein [Actinomadura darangshiensis]